MGIDAVIAAGDGRAARKIFKRNKALLDVAGKPIIRHICEALLSSNEIDRIVVVGPKESFEEVIGDLDVHIVGQKRNLAENGWEGFLQTIPEYRQTGILTDHIIEKYRNKYVLFLSGDIPLLTRQEMEEFISKCDMERYDYIAGITLEKTLNLFGPTKGRPGIKMATFHAKDGKFRQNNLHLCKPFVLYDHIDLILKIYEFRYQKELKNIIMATIEIVKLGPWHIGYTLGLYILLQLSTGLTALGLGLLARISSFPVTRKRLEKAASAMLGARCTTVETTIGGAALDVDNEKDFLTLSIMYKDWIQQIHQTDYHYSSR